MSKKPAKKTAAKKAKKAAAASELIQPKQMGDELLADITSTRNDEGKNFRIWWLGQSGYLVQFQGSHLLFDPYLSDSLTRKYAETDKPHVRMTELAIDPARLDFIDIVTSSHNHTDHLDGETLGPLLEANPAISLVAPEANRAFVADRLGIDPSRPCGLVNGQSIEHGPFKLTAVPAAHEALDTDDEDRHLYLGYVAEFGDWTVYHSGDTMLFDGMVETLNSWAIDLAILPINGRAPERRVAGNLTGFEAACLAKDIGARFVTPCHYEMFEFNTASPAPFAADCARLGQDFRVLECGEKLSSAELLARA